MNNRDRLLPGSPTYFHRARIDELLQTAILRHHVLTVIAGPGYGKTTAVARFVQPLKEKIVWLHIAPTDNDIACFWHSFLDALRQELPDVAGQLVEETFPAGADRVVRLADLLNQALETETAIFVIDNFENIKNQEITAFFQNLTGILFRHVHFVFIGMVRIPSGQGFETCAKCPQITEKELRFTPREAQGFFAELPVPLPARLLEDINEYTAGWPLALGQIWTTLGENGPVGNFMPRTITELFQHGYYSQYDDTTRPLLIQLSTLPCFSVDIMGMVLEDGLKDAVRSISQNMFVEFDVVTNLFRFHPMYKNFLVTKTFFVDTEKLRQLQQAAGRWFAARDMLPEAAECFQDCCQYDNFLEVTMRILDKKKNHSGRFNWQKLIDIVQKMPASERESKPLVDYCTGFIYWYAKSYFLAERCFLRFVERTHASGASAQLAESYAVLAILDLFRGGSKAVMYVQAMSNNMVIHWAAGDIFSDITNNYGYFFLTDNTPGRLKLMVQWGYDMARRVNTGCADCSYGYELLFDANARLNTLELDGAEELGIQLMNQAQGYGHHHTVCYACFLLMRANCLRGDYQKAEEYLQIIAATVDNHGLLWLLELKECDTIWLKIKMQDIGRIQEWLGTADKMIGGSDYPYNENTMLIRAYCFMVLRDFSRAFDILVWLGTRTGHASMWMIRLLVFIMKAWYYMEQRDAENAEEAFYRAYEMAWPNNIMAPFIEFGHVMQDLILQIRGQDKHAFDSKWLNRVYSESIKYTAHLSDMKTAYNVHTPANISYEMLTPREIEILRLLAQGLTRQEIAQISNISINGVKKHLTNIYTKLRAINRADAIHIATVNGIIDPVTR